MKLALNTSCRLYDDMEFGFGKLRIGSLIFAKYILLQQIFDVILTKLNYALLKRYQRLFNYIKMSIIVLLTLESNNK